MDKCWNCQVCFICDTDPCICEEVTHKYDLNKIKFGKYEGSTFRNLLDVNPEYLEWLISNVPKYKISDDLYDYIYVHRDKITSNAKKKRRR